MTARKICILGLEDYAMLTGDPKYGHIGGESVQHVLLARAWRDLGHDVTIIVYDHGQAGELMLDGIRVMSAFAPNGGLPGLRFFHPRLSGVTRALARADADVYFQSPAAHWSGVVVNHAKRAHRKSILRMASDSDCVRGQMPSHYKGQSLRFKRDRWMYDYGVLNASLIAAQTAVQHDLLAKHFGVHSEILNIAVEVPKATATKKDIDVLWVGNFRQVKRPDLAVELARRLPQFRFAFVGGPVRGSEAYFERIAREAQALANVEFAGALPYEAVGGWFDRSRVHINTSDYEGFPNTFLQAWIRRLPVVSFFDPDRVIERRKLGRCSKGVDGMSHDLKQLLDSPAECSEVGARGYAYAASEFSAHHIASRYLDLLQAGDLAAPRAHAPG